jgi:hypothetical protein
MIDEEGIHESYLETRRVLDEALMEGEVLRAQLRTLEAPNQPAKFLEPVVIRTVQSIRGGHRDDHQSDGDLLLEYQQLRRAEGAASGSQDK